MKFLFLLLTLVGCTRTTPAKKLAKEPINFSVGDCLVYDHQTLKITAKGKFSYSLAKYDPSDESFNYENMRTFPIVDATEKANPITCPETLSSAEKSNLEAMHDKFMKTKTLPSNDSPYSVGSCVHLSSMVYKITAHKNDYYVIAESHEPKQSHKKTDKLPYWIVKASLLKERSVQSDCREDLYKLHKALADTK